METTPAQLAMDLGESRLPQVLLPSKEALGLVDGEESAQKSLNLDAYTKAAARAVEEGALSKALAPPPSAFSFSTMSYMPDPQAGGLISWPGIPPESIQRLARTNIIPEMIIGQRVVDVLLYANRATHLWRPGWKIELRESSKQPTTADKMEIRKAEAFIENCNMEIASNHPRERDAAGYTSFATFLAKTTRDFLMYDSIALYTDMDRAGRVKAWSNLPAGNIRLADPQVGYRQNPSWFAVMVDQGGSVKQAFTREELIWHVGNPRTDPDIGGYGYSRIEVAMKLIESFQNAIDLNADVFTKSGIPMGMILLQGMGFTQNELDAITRQWQNLKKGASKVWALPAMVVPRDSKVEFLNLSAAHGQDAMYVHHMNLTAGVFCNIMQFPHRRIGWHLSGGAKDSEPLDVQMKQPTPQDEEDTGKTSLLRTLECVINSYILWTRWPQLQLTFTGKSPREDAREYEARQLARTWGERRAEVDLPPLEKLVDSEDEELLGPVAKLLALCPADPALAGVFQSVVGAILKGQSEGPGGQSATPGAPFPSAKDPSSGLSHGQTPGVRRHGGRADSRKRESLI